MVNAVKVPSIRVYVPRDSSALSVGAERTAKAIGAEAAKRGRSEERRVGKEC